MMKLYCCKICKGVLFKSSKWIEEIKGMYFEIDCPKCKNENIIKEFEEPKIV